MAKRKPKPDAAPPPVVYTITVTREQAYLLQNACELIARLGMGQVDEVELYLPFAEGYDICASKHVLEDFERGIKPFCGLSQNAFYSMAGDGTTDNAKRAWGLYTTIRHRLSWDRAVAEGIVAEGEQRKWPEMMTVNYDEPKCYVMGEPTPRISRVTDPSTATHREDD